MEVKDQIEPCLFFNKAVRMLTS